MSDNLMTATATIVAAYLTGPETGAHIDVVGLIKGVGGALRAAADGLPNTEGDDRASPYKAPAYRAKPAKNTHKSLRLWAEATSQDGDEILCLDCRKWHKVLKGHLRSKHGMSVADYRVKWGPNAPVVSPNYSADRADRARRIGLGFSRLRSEPREDLIVGE